MTIHAEETPSTQERVSHLDGAYARLSAKADAVASEARTMDRIAQARTETAESDARANKRSAESDARANENLAELKTAIAESRTTIADGRTRMIRWTAAVGGFAVGAITLIDRLL